MHGGVGLRQLSLVCVDGFPDQLVNCLVHEPEDHVAKDPNIVESVLRRLSLSGRRPSSVGGSETNLLDSTNKDPLAA